MYSSGKTLGFKDFASEDDLEKAMNIKWDMLYLKSIPTDTEIQIYEYELKDFKVNTSEETLYVRTTHGETITYEEYGELETLNKGSYKVFTVIVTNVGISTYNCIARDEKDAIRLVNNVTNGEMKVVNEMPLQSMII